MSVETKPIIPEGSATVAGRDIEYTTLVALGVGVLLGMILKA